MQNFMTAGRLSYTAILLVTMVSTATQAVMKMMPSRGSALKTLSVLKNSSFDPKENDAFFGTEKPTFSSDKNPIDAKNAAIAIVATLPAIGLLSETYAHFAPLVAVPAVVAAAKRFTRYRREVKLRELRNLLVYTSHQRGNSESLESSPELDQVLRQYGEAAQEKIFEHATRILGKLSDRDKESLTFSSPETKIFAYLYAQTFNSLVGTNWASLLFGGSPAYFSKTTALGIFQFDLDPSGKANKIYFPNGKAYDQFRFLDNLLTKDFDKTENAKAVRETGLIVK